MQTDYQYTYLHAYGSIINRNMVSGLSTPKLLISFHQRKLRIHS